jgi:hypothetical protein
MATKPARRQFSIRISDLHIATVQELREAGFTVYGIFESAIDRFYADMHKAGLVAGKALEEGTPADSMLRGQQLGGR